jgi:hypothetical protein
MTGHAVFHTVIGLRTVKASARVPLGVVALDLRSGVFGHLSLHITSGVVGTARVGAVEQSVLVVVRPIVTLARVVPFQRWVVHESGFSFDRGTIRGHHRHTAPRPVHPIAFLAVIRWTAGTR